MESRAVVPSAVGEWVIEGDAHGIDRIYLAQLPLHTNATPPAPPVRSAARQLREYFAGKRREFDLDLHLVGTAFQQTVWTQLTTIPFGLVCSYGDVALAIDHPHAYRAVGNANAKNPWAIVVPCHRVVASKSIGGYGGRLDVKRFLLRLEGVRDYDEVSATGSPASLG